MQSFVDKFVEFSARLANQVHLRSLRDAFATVMPIFILAGLAVLVNNVVFPWVLEGDTLTQFKVWGEAIINGTLNIAALLLAPMIAWSLARNKDFDNPVSAVAIAFNSFIIMMPMRLQITPVGSDAPVNVTQVLTFANIGSTGIFAGVLIGLLSTELFIAISRLKALHISLGENVPPAVSKSFTALIPTILTLSLFAVLAAILANVLHTDLIHLITTFIQQPLRLINTSLPGTIFIYSFGNFLFTLGIHQSVVNSVVLEPFSADHHQREHAGLCQRPADPTHHQQHFCADLWHGGRDGQHYLIADRYLHLLKTEISEAGGASVTGAGSVQHQRAGDFRPADCL